MRELTCCELNEICGGIGISMGSVGAQFTALGGLVSSGSYLWGNIARGQESTIAGFTSNMIGGMAAGAVGVGVSAVTAVKATKVFGEAAKAGVNANGAAVSALGGGYIAAGVGAAVEMAINKSVEAIEAFDRSFDE